MEASFEDTTHGWMHAKKEMITIDWKSVLYGPGEGLPYHR